jgi:hypothetical protein
MLYADPTKRREYLQQYKRSDVYLAKEAGYRAVEQATVKRRRSTEPEFVERQREADRRYYEAHPEKIRAKSARERKLKGPLYYRNKQLKALYGIQHTDYERMLAEQGGRCAICASDKPGPGRKKYFSVDHDHATNKVRALLCDPCNNGLGRFKDDPELLARAIAYLKHHGIG